MIDPLVTIRAIHFASAVMVAGAVLPSQIGAAYAAPGNANANFVGFWVTTPDYGDFTIATEDASGACTGTCVYPMTACQVTGSAYTFTLTTGSYSSVTDGTISGNILTGEFTDNAGHTDIQYTATRASTGPSITSLDKRAGPVTGGTSVVVTGTGFGSIVVPAGGLLSVTLKVKSPDVTLLGTSGTVNPTPCAPRSNSTVPETAL